MILKHNYDFTNSKNDIKINELSLQYKDYCCRVDLDETNSFNIDNVLNLEIKSIEELTLLIKICTDFKEYLLTKI